MKWTSLNDLREKYLAFFESKGHLRLPSFSLVPNNDKSLLLINSGMAPMKKFFTGEEIPPRNRVCTCQKCIRTPDLDRVGHTARHGTYFEMLGNFSFGDYFKNEAIPWAWEFLTVTLEIPSDLLWPSVYEHDEEAYALWRDVIGVPEEHIVRLGKADNFWEHGSGPCGPCSEIYFDRGIKYGCGSPDCKPGCDCDRFMEIWNNVFSQFNNDGNGNYTELAQKNIDTGMGLERLACVMQGVDNLFEVDTVRRILDTVCAIAGKTYGKDKANDVSIRVVTDHIRSATFMISDGVIPSNEGRGYVLRRILRRACRHGKLLGINRKFMTELCEVVISQNESAYPELVEKSEYILKVISLEEDRFNATVDSGLAILAGIESLLSCVVSDGMINDKHNSNTELIAQGLGNIASGLFGGIPATGAIARTAANVKNGGRTPVAGMVHAITLLLILVILMPYAALIPMPTIAAILFMVAYNMSEWKKFVYLCKTAPKSDIIVLVTTFVLTVVFDLVIAIEIGMILAALLFMKRMSEETEIQGWKYLDEENDPDSLSLKEVPANTRVYEISGPLFFGAADKILNISLQEGDKCLILRMRGVTAIDATAMNALEQLFKSCQQKGIQLILSHVNEQPMNVMKKSLFLSKVGKANFCNHIDEALKRAEELQQ